MSGRSTPLLGRRKLASALPLLAFVAYVAWTDRNWASWEVWPLFLFFSLAAALTLSVMLAGVLWRDFAALPVAEGRVLAIVPAYDEEPELLRGTVLSLVHQSRPPDEIHVVDDGSPHPAQPFEAPGVTWHRYEGNRGKRYAQAHALRLFAPGDFDFVLTADSDSVLDRDAVEHMLRPMSDPGVQAGSGMILMRNFDDNLLTRLVDINVVTSCLMFRMWRSWFGLVTPTSGCLAIYRAPLVYDNLADYVTSGTAGDDRRLSFYALLRGEVVAIPRAVVETQLPSTYRGTFRQRTRWSKSAWLGVPFVMTNLPGPAVLIYLYPLVFALMWPFVVLVLGKIALDFSRPVFLYGVVFWVVTATCATWVYALYRPSLTRAQRVQQWLLGPVYPVLGLLLLRPATYWALTQLRSTSWHTRGAEHTGLAAAQIDLTDVALVDGARR